MFLKSVPSRKGFTMGKGNFFKKGKIADGVFKTEATGDAAKNEVKKNVVDDNKPESSQSKVVETSGKTKFACNGSKLLSSGADKSMVFRNIESTSTGLKSTRYHQEMASRGTVYDMDIDPSNKLAVTVGQDKKLNVLNLASEKSVRSFKPEGDAGEPIKVRADHSGSFLVCSHSDKSMRIYDFLNGDLVCLGQGHTEVITGVTFMPDCRRLISVSGDSCIFVWRLPSTLAKMMRKRCITRTESQTLHSYTQLLDSKGHQDAMQNPPIHRNLVSVADVDTAVCDVFSTVPQLTNSITPAFKFSVSRLPHWAQAKVAETIVERDENDSKENSVHSSESRWAERLGPEGYKLFSEPQVVTPPATIHPSRFCLRRRFTIEGASASTCNTPESSVESQPSGASASSPKASERMDTHWKTVHTLFFDEEDFFQDDASSSGHQLRTVADNVETRDETELIYSGEHFRGLQNVRRDEQELQEGRNDDSVVVYRSDDELESRTPLNSLISGYKCDDKFRSGKEIRGEPLKTSAPLLCMLTNSNERVSTISLQSTQMAMLSSGHEFLNEVKISEQSIPESLIGKEGVEGSEHEDQMVLPIRDDLSEEDEDNEQYISPGKDLFSAHFGKLSTAIKVHTGQASARSSFSARFFAQASHTMPILSLFQESPIMDIAHTLNRISSPTEAGNTSLLAKERECLKLRERQDNMAIEVQQMREHLAHLGITTTEAASLPDKQLLCEEAPMENLHKDRPQPRPAFITAVRSQGQKPSSLQTCSAKLSPQSSSSVIGCVGYTSEEQRIPFDKDCSKMDLEKKNEVNTDLIEFQPEFPGGWQDTLPGQKSRDDEGVKSGTSADLPTEMPLNPLIPSNSVDKYKNALQEMSRAVDNALDLFKGLESLDSKDANTLVPNLSSLYQEFMPPTLQKVWLLSDFMVSSHQLDSSNAPACDIPSTMEYSTNLSFGHCSVRSSRNEIMDIQSRPGTAASLAPTTSALEAIDIEGFIQRYSVRFSATLASQVLALVQKGMGVSSECSTLGSGQESCDLQKNDSL